MVDKMIFKNENLVLKVSNSYDPLKLNLDEWDDFLDILCGNRYYQKEAIKTAVIYLASGQYNVLEDLVKENFEFNNELIKKFEDFNNYREELQIKNKLFANIDLATGTGKSYVIYGIAQIMLGTGLIDKVLVLCPSLTIEDGLMDKFKRLSADSNLMKSIPESSKIKIPSIINANTTITEGSICIENIHAVYEKTKSSIDDSLKNNGSKVLVLNDESHHIFNKTKDESLKKWKEFLINDDYNFKYILGFTGTAYIENDYFNDVIYRYSLRKAIEERYVKDIEYAVKDDSIGKDEKFQKIYHNHNTNKNKYALIKPLTIFVTSNIAGAENLSDDFIDFLCKKEAISEEEASEKVLVIHNKSSNDDKIRLKYVDEKENNKVEWIFSVSMLTEGWDTKNVLQIVPWEDRAFNSKLLIAQVLGRGLRVPKEYLNNIPSVKVFNHVAWSRSIEELVNEILEIDTKLISNTVSGERKKYNMKIKNINYNKIEKEINKEPKKDISFENLLKKGINLESQVLRVEKNTGFQSIYKNNISEMNYEINRITYTIDEVVDSVWNNFADRDWEGKILHLNEEEYTQNKIPDKKAIKDLIELSMKKVGITDEFLTEKNRNIVLQSFGPLLRKKNKTVISKLKLNNIDEIATEDIAEQSLAIGNLRNDWTVFYSDDYNREMDEKQRKILEEFLDDESRPVSSAKLINQYLFKTSLNIIFTNRKPEREFLLKLCKQENAQMIDSWIKSRDTNFYSIEYSWKKNTHQKQGSFNPDFFIKVKKDDITYFLVVEIKDDGDACEENKAKYKYAVNHFENLNKELNKDGINEVYIFHFLSPKNYPEFFEYLKNGKIFKNQENFRCELENLLEEK